MTDLDFDELDKAVNALVNKSSDEPEAAKPKSNSKQEPPATIIKPDESLATDKPSPLLHKPFKAAGQSGATAAAKPMAAAPLNLPKRARLGQKSAPSQPSGRRPQGMIDIIAPSQPPKSKREAAVIRPIKIAEEPSDDKPSKEQAAPQMPSKSDAAAEEKFVPVLVVHQKPKPAVAPEPVKNRTAKKDDESWPDPLDFHDEQIEELASLHKSGTAEDDEAETPYQHEAEDDNKTDSSQPSPFISGAKVEKRPLGAFSHVEPKPPKVIKPLPSAKKTIEPDEPKEKTKPGSIPTPPSIPAELKPEVLAVESGEHWEGPEPAPPPSVAAIAKETEETPQIQTQPKEDLKKTMHASAMTSISPQYKQTQKNVDSAPRPVFDTKEYHPPLLEGHLPPHHESRSDWLRLVLALILLAAIGAAAYYGFMYFVQNF